MSTIPEVRCPHTFRMLTVRGIYIRLALALVLVLIPAVFRSGATVVVLAVSAIGGGILAELVVGLGSDLSVRRSGIGNGRVLYYALLVTALAPTTATPVVVAVATAAAVLVGLWLPGGPGAYWLHPVLVGLALLPGLSLMTGSDPLAAGTGVLPGIVESSQAFAFLDGRVFGPLGLSVSPSAIAAITGFSGSTPATVTAGLLLPLLIAAMVVLGEDVVPPVLPVSYLFVFAIVVDLLGGDVLSATLAGNVPVLALIALADPGVRPHRRRDIVLFGAIAGGLTAVLTAFGGTGMPGVAGLLLAGTLRPLLDRASRGRTL